MAHKVVGILRSSSHQLHNAALERLRGGKNHMLIQVVQIHLQG